MPGKNWLILKQFIKTAKYSKVSYQSRKHSYPLSDVEGRDEVFLLVAEGESVDGPILQIGNTNCRYRFSIGAKEFMNQWSKQTPAHHCAIGVGHIANNIEKLGHLIQIRVVQICKCLGRRHKNNSFIELLSQVETFVRF